MRRSAAPSQRLKRPIFCPPLLSPPEKRVCKPGELVLNETSAKAPLRNKDLVELNSQSLPDSVGDFVNQARYFSVLWCKLSGRKHKKWEGDAIISVKNRTVVLKDLEGKELGRNSGYKVKDLEELSDGCTLPIGNKEIEIQNVIKEEDYLSGKCFNTNICTEIIEKVMPRAIPKPFRLPTKHNKENVAHPGKPLYDVTNPYCIVLQRPPAHHQWKNTSNSASVNDVVVDPYLGSKLRPHQKVGVSFLYESVMGFRTQGFYGAILADEMGLGKTLQCITLIWTLLKQGPYEKKPICRRVLVITPSSLTNNWRKEFDKWLGKERIDVYVVDPQNKIETYKYRRLCPVLIISYEMAVRSIDIIKDLNFDLMLCDEGHRLKNSNIKTTSQLASIPIKKKVILSGTPIQNDMQELFALSDFVNPGILGTSQMFKRVYEEPVVKSKQPNATVDEKEIGESRGKELNCLISGFILRRTQEIINRYLPPKSEFVVFCQPMKSQAEIYSAFIQSKEVQNCLFSGEYNDHLSAICSLRKLCNHPDLLKGDGTLFSEEDSGKLAVVSCMLYHLSDTTKEKIVIVSNFTTTLDMLQKLCERYQYKYLRLDGSTPSTKRQQLVDRFNSKSSMDFVFLLSAKAGGVGLNLIGSSRIILFDIDWNPATDLQAMARVWRDGQKNHVYIYRLLLTGSLEEKMYQRQICKQGISGSVVDSTSTNVQFSSDEIKDLFRFDLDTVCSTHDLLNCSCDMCGKAQMLLPSEGEQRSCQIGNLNTRTTKRTTMDQLFKWQHYSAPFEDGCLGDHCLEAGADFITFVMKTNSTDDFALNIEH